MKIDGNASQSVVVTGDGNMVCLKFGDSRVELTLLRKHVRLPDQKQPARSGEAPRELDLLDPERATLPFIGRVDMMEALHGWVESEAGVSVFAITGRAGSGKTCLALELCRALDPEGESGRWRAGFLSGSDLAEVVKALATRRFNWADSPQVLVVIDNAAQCYQALAMWLDKLAHEQFGKARLRVLLLEREAPEKFGWWSDLTGDWKRNRLFHALRPLALPGLADVEERRALVGAALAGAAEARSMAAPDVVPAAGVEPGVDRALAGVQFGSPLNLVMAGVLALDQGLGAALSLRRLDAAHLLGGRELKRFRELAAGAGVSDNALRHAIAFNALVGGLPSSTLLDTLAGELKAARVEAGELRDLADLLAQELPPRQVDGSSGDEDRLGVIQPDLVAEAVTIAVFTGGSWREVEGAKALARAYALDPDRSSAALMRLLQDFAYATEDPTASEDEQVMGARVMRWLRALVDSVEDGLALAPIAYALPEHSLILREIAADVQARVAEACRRRAGNGNRMDDADAVAAAANNLANRLGDLGRWEAALEAAQEAVRLRRAQVDVRPNVFTSNLSTALNTLANSSSSLGRWEEALKAAQEATDLHRALAAARPDTFTPDLAMSLNNLANKLGNFGRREAALEAANEAVNLYRGVAATRLDAFTPDLAGALNNLAGRLSELGHREAAYSAVQESIGLYRTLATTRPDAFTPGLAGALNTLANMLNGLGHWEAAADAAQESVDLHRTLADTRPDVFMPHLSMSLSNLANRLNSLGRRDAALKMAQEAVDLDRVLANACPDAFTPSLAASLNNLANIASGPDRQEASLEAAQESVALRRAMAAKRPDAFEPGLAVSLHTLANRLGDLRRPDAALEAAQETVDLHRGLAAARPNVFASDLAMSLNTLADRLGDLGRKDAALEAAQECVALCRAVAATCPDAFTRDLAKSLNNFANRLGDLGRRDAALEAAQESVATHRVLDAARPGAFRSSFARSLSNLAIRLSGLKPLAPALETGREAVELYRVLAASDYNVLTDLARSLWILGELLAHDGQAQEGIDSLKEAIVLLTPATFAHSGASRRRINDVVRSYLARCKEAGVEPDAALLRPFLPLTDETGEST